MKRSGIRSPSKPDTWARQRHVRHAVFVRDRHCLVRGLTDLACGGGLTFHHRRKAGASGAYTVENGAAVCLFHNGWIEDNPNQARILFRHLVVREGDPEWDSLSARLARKSCPECHGTRFEPTGEPCGGCSGDSGG